MLYIHSNNISTKDYDDIINIFMTAGFQKHEIKIIDIDISDFEEVGPNKCLIVLGKRSINEATKYFLKNGLINTSTFFGSSLVDHNALFFYFGINETISELLAANQEVKDTVWSTILQARELYSSWFPFNDPLDFGGEIKEVKNEVSEIKNDIDLQIADGGQEEEDNSLFVIKEDSDTESGMPEDNVVYCNPEVSNHGINVMEVLDKLIEKINLVDPGLGKSLTKYDKIELDCNGSTFNVFPTNRMPKTEAGEVNVTFKDLVVLLKVALTLDCKTISFDIKEKDVPKSD